MTLQTRAPADVLSSKNVTLQTQAPTDPLDVSMELEVKVWLLSSEIDFSRCEHQIGMYNTGTLTHVVKFLTRVGESFTLIV